MGSTQARLSSSQTWPANSMPRRKRECRHDSVSVPETTSNLRTITASSRTLMRLSFLLELHNHLRRSWPIFRPFIANPGVRWRSREPEKRFRKECTEDVEKTQMGNQFNLVALKLSSRRLYHFLAAQFESH